MDENRRVARITATATMTVVVLAGLLLMAWEARRVLVWIALAAFLAAGLDPVVRMVASRMRVPRGVAIAVVAGAVIGLMAAIVWLLVPAVVEASQALVRNGPEYARSLRGEPWVRWLDEHLGVTAAVQRAGRQLLEGSGGPLGIAQAAAEWVFTWITVIVLMILLLMYGRGIRDWVVRAWVPATRQRRAAALSGRASSVISGYLVGNLAVSVVAGAVSWVGLWLLGVPYAPVLAVWIAVADLIPVVGATLGAIPAIAAAATVSWPVAIGAAVLLVGYQQAENHLLQPIAMRWAVRLNALTTVIVVLVGAELMGIIGALVAIPVAGVIQVAAREGPFGVDGGAREQGEPTQPEPHQHHDDRCQHPPGALVGARQSDVEGEAGRGHQPERHRGDAAGGEQS